MVGSALPRAGPKCTANLAGIGSPEQPGPSPRCCPTRSHSSSTRYGHAATHSSAVMSTHLKGLLVLVWFCWGTHRAVPCACCLIDLVRLQLLTFPALMLPGGSSSSSSARDSSVTASARAQRADPGLSAMTGRNAVALGTRHACRRQPAWQSSPTSPAIAA